MQSEGEAATRRISASGRKSARSAPWIVHRSNDADKNAPQEYRFTQGLANCAATCQRDGAVPRKDPGQVFFGNFLLAADSFLLPQLAARSIVA
jgi:hypothetical protein